MANEKSAKNGDRHTHLDADASRPSRAGGATFVFFAGPQRERPRHRAVIGYYGDSTTSQHGFIYNTNTGQYTFVDDPEEAFSNGVEVTQITGIHELRRDHGVLLGRQRGFSTASIGQV